MIEHYILIKKRVAKKGEVEGVKTIKEGLERGDKVVNEFVFSH